MGVVDVTKKWSGNAASAEGDLKTGTRGTTQGYSVTVSDPANDDAATVRRAVGIPRVSDPFPTDFSMRCRRVNVSRAGLILFDVVAEYEAPSVTEDQNPLDVPAQIEWDFVDENGQIDRDINNKPITTKAGEPIPVNETKSDILLTITRNNASFDPLQAAEYKNTVNSDDFLAFPPGCCKLVGIRSSNVFDGDFEYWRTTTVVHIRRGAPYVSDDKAWWPRVRHEGHYELQTKIVREVDKDTGAVTNKTVATAVRCVDGDGNYVTSPVSLKDDGTREYDPTIGHFLEFETVEKKAFGPLNLL